MPGHMLSQVTAWSTCVAFPTTLARASCPLCVRDSPHLDRWFSLTPRATATTMPSTSTPTAGVGLGIARSGSRREKRRLPARRAPQAMSPRTYRDRSAGTRGATSRLRFCCTARARAKRPRVDGSEGAATGPLRRPTSLREELRRTPQGAMVGGAAGPVATIWRELVAQPLIARGVAKDIAYLGVRGNDVYWPPQKRAGEYEAALHPREQQPHHRSDFSMRRCPYNVPVDPVVASSPACDRDRWRSANPCPEIQASSTVTSTRSSYRLCWTCWTAASRRARIQMSQRPTERSSNPDDEVVTAGAHKSRPLWVSSRKTTDPRGVTNRGTLLPKSLFMSHRVNGIHHTITIQDPPRVIRNIASM